MSHKKEPWILRQGNEIGVADKSDKQSYGMLNVIARADKYDFENWQENAKRIVLCVNYCAGEPDAALELFTAAEQVDLKIKFAQERDTYRELCGELLLALAYHQAVMALLRDEGQAALADLYPSMSNGGKNSCYQSVEWIIRDCLNNYNWGVDLDKELAGDIPLTNGERACV